MPVVLLMAGLLHAVKSPPLELLAQQTKPAASKSAPFIVANGLAVEPFAKEQLSNPARIDVDDRGRVWVAEAFNYRKKTR